jgi:uncharacterized FlaG/YvyC family protein
VAIIALDPIRLIPTSDRPPLVPQMDLSNREAVAAVEAINKLELLGQNNELVFQVDPQTRRPVMLIRNRYSKEVLVRVPPDYVLRLAAELRRK